MRPKVYLFKRRELAMFVHELGREGLTLTNRDAALRMIAAKGWDAADLDLVRRVTEAIKSAKTGNAGQRGVPSKGRRGTAILWEIPAAKPDEVICIIA